MAPRKPNYYGSLAEYKESAGEQQIDSGGGSPYPVTGLGSAYRNVPSKQKIYGKQYRAQQKAIKQQEAIANQAAAAKRMEIAETKYGKMWDEMGIIRDRNNPAFKESAQKYLERPSPKYHNFKKGIHTKEDLELYEEAQRIIRATRWATRTGILPKKIVQIKK